uniref:Uncharacterized protein n=1 Tax=Astyanax mexicanus TaxID=7994 RepID=A0A8B9HHT8_ASTMX
PCINYIPLHNDVLLFCVCKLTEYENVQGEAKASMNSPQRVYRGQELIGAKPKPIPNTISNYHSEYLLLILSNPPKESPDGPLMQKLLNSDPKGCVIFYTLNSPCVNSCSTPTAKYSIIPALDGIKKHKGPKAFVFGQVWKHDENKAQWEMNMKEINIKVPLYRCNNAGCTRCVDDNNVVQARCKANYSRGMNTSANHFTSLYYLFCYLFF